MARVRRLKRTERTEAVSIVLSAMMAGAMIVGAAISGSVSILAEGIDTILDIVASIAVLAGIRLSEHRSPTFPQGLYKLENLIATCIGLLILYGAYGLAREAIGRLLKKSPELEQPWLVIGVMLGVVAITGFIAWYKSKVGHQENSPSLVADARHSWTDVVASIAVVIGVGLQAAGIPHMDSIAALVVVAFLAWSGVQVVLDGLKVLLDASIDRDTLERMKNSVESNPGVRKVVLLNGRNSGSYRFLHLVIVPASSYLEETEKAAEELITDIRREFGHIDNVQVEFTVEKTGVLVSAVPVLEDRTTLSTLFGEAPYFRITEIDATRGIVTTREDLENPAGRERGGPDIRAAVALARRGVDVLLLKEEPGSRGALHVMEANNVGVIVNHDICDIRQAEQAILEYSPTKTSTESGAH